MNDVLHHAAFSIYPYIALAVFFLGSLLRFETDQYGWRSKSSQLLRQRQFMIGSYLFHIGILLLFVGHFVGLLTPVKVFQTLGISLGAKQMLASVAGGIFGVMAFVGLTILLHRRLADPRIRKTSTFSDVFILVLLWVQLVLGLATVPLSLGHPSGEEMVKFMNWAQSIVTFQLGAGAYVADVHWVFKAHLFLGLTIFLVFPFTRLVHVWSAPIWYLGRRYQVVRTRRGEELREAARARGATTAPPTPAPSAPAAPRPRVGTA